MSAWSNCWWDRAAGPAEAPSTSAGIGIEVWLPAKAQWNARMHNLGGGGWAGGRQTSTTDRQHGGSLGGRCRRRRVVNHRHWAHRGCSGAFAMNPDGTINETLWNDFSHRALHEQAVKTRTLATAYYGTPPRYSYWEGGSTGGRQGLKLVQLYPGDYDGLIANYPANNWIKFITAELYPQIIYQRDLGGTPLTSAQLNLMGNAAITACGSVAGQNLVNRATRQVDARTARALDFSAAKVRSGGVAERRGRGRGPGFAFQRRPRESTPEDDANTC